jgi:hypothetical protein
VLKENDEIGATAAAGVAIFSEYLASTELRRWPDVGT